jgi:riboflavin kinase/FMN adenylyltransferase
VTIPLPLPDAGTVVTVGSFDGVHLGHAAVLREIAARARAANRASVLVTFEPHPMEVVNPASAPLLLTTPVERREILAQSELDDAVILRFDERLRALAPEDFVRYRSGWWPASWSSARITAPRGRAGDVEMLRVLGFRCGFAVEVVPPVTDPVAGIVSSSRIRTAIAHGDLPLARRMLGRPFTLSAVVAPGAKRGRTIGVPTVNLPVPPRKALPPDGVYAVRVEWPGGISGGMLNQGHRPTVGDLSRTIEAHLFDFEGDL